MIGLAPEFFFDVSLDGETMLCEFNLPTCPRDDELAIRRFELLDVDNPAVDLGEDELAMGNIVVFDPDDSDIDPGRNISSVGSPVVIPVVCAANIKCVLFPIVCSFEAEDDLDPG